jgi:hypothetical protein
MNPLQQVTSMRESFKRMHVLSELCSDLEGDSEKLKYAKDEIVRLVRINSGLIKKMKTKDHPR